MCTIVIFFIFTIKVISAGHHNITAIPVGSGEVKFSWLANASADEDIYHILCSPDLSYGDFVEELSTFTTSTSALLSGFQERTGYECTLSTSDNMDEIIRVDAKRFGGLSINFVGDTPFVESNSILAKFIIGGSASNVVCCLNPKPQSGNKCVKCTDGQVSYSNVNAGNYRLSVFAKNSNYDTIVIRRVVSVPNSTYGCAVNLINDGFIASGSSITIQFAGVGDLTGYACFLDNQGLNDECSSPIVLETLDSGWHSFKIIPVGNNCIERQTLKLSFSV